MTPGTPFPQISLKYATPAEALAAQEALSLVQLALSSHADVLVRQAPTVRSEVDPATQKATHFVDTRFGVRAPVGEKPILLRVEGGVFPEVFTFSRPPMGAAHVMVDLETLGRRAGCQVLSLGAVFFGPDGLGDEFYRNLKLEEQADMGLTTDEDTVKWWSRQSPEARAALEVDRVHPTRALIDFGDWLKARSPEPRFWGNGASFDEPILIAAHEALKVSVSWKYRNSRCFRTLKELHKNVPWKGDRGVAHHALDDAKSQALHAVKILNSIPNGWATV